MRASAARQRGSGPGTRPRPGLGPAAVLLAPALLLAGVFAAPAAAQRAGTGPEVVAVEFHGARAVRPEALRSAIATRATSCGLPAFPPACWLGFSLDRHHLDRDVLRADALRLRLFYYRQGYREAEVEHDTVSHGDGVRVLFRIQEGRPVRVASVEVAGLPPDSRVGVGGLPIRPGQPFATPAFEAARDTLANRLRNRGYARAEVLASYLIPADSPYAAEIVYEAIPGGRARVGSIEVVGARNVAPAVVRRMLTFEPGDLFRQEEMLRSQRNLFRLDIFKHAEIRPRYDAEPDSLIPVVVQVNEGDLHRVRLGGGMDTAECLNAEGRWTSRNFLGGARRLEVRGRVSNVLASTLGSFPCFDSGRGIYSELNGFLGADFTQPWFFGSLNTLGAGIFAERHSLPDVFVRTAAGGYVTVTRTLGPRTSATLGYQPQLTKLAAEGDIFYCVSFVACEAGDVRALRDARRLAPLAASLVRDRSNAIFAPTRGYILRLEAELAATATGSDFAYARLLGEGTGYWEAHPGFVLAGRLRPGWARAAGGAGSGLGLHPQKRFFAGGPNSVRGFAQYRLGPKVLTVDAAGVLAAPADTLGRGAGCSATAINDGSCDARMLSPRAFEVRPVGGAAVLEGNLELRFPIWRDKLRGAAFLDFGQVWSNHDEIGLESLVFTPGMGVRYFSPVGPIRVDVGYNASGAERLQVITTEVCEVRPDGSCGPPEDGGAGDLRNTSRLRPLAEPVLWNPRGSLLDRLQLHISIGQAF